MRIIGLAGAGPVSLIRPLMVPVPADLSGGGAA